MLYTLYYILYTVGRRVCAVTLPCNGRSCVTPYFKSRGQASSVILINVPIVILIVTVHGSRSRVVSKLSDARWAFHSLLHEVLALNRQRAAAVPRPIRPGTAARVLHHRLSETIRGSLQPRQWTALRRYGDLHGLCAACVRTRPLEAIPGNLDISGYVHSACAEDNGILGIQHGSCAVVGGTVSTALGSGHGLGAITFCFTLWCARLVAVFHNSYTGFPRGGNALTH